MKIIAGVIIYVFSMFSIMMAISTGISMGLKDFFNNNQFSKDGGKKK